MDLFGMIYSANTFVEHPTESKWNTSGNNGVFRILKSSNYADINIFPDKPAFPQDLNDTVLKPNEIV